MRCAGAFSVSCTHHNCHPVNFFSIAFSEHAVDTMTLQTISSPYPSIYASTSDFSGQAKWFGYNELSAEPLPQTEIEPKSCLKFKKLS